MNTPKKIAIVRLTAMGDIIHSMVALQFIKKNYPRTVLSWVVEEKFAEILKQNRDIDQIIPVNLHSLKSDKSLQNVNHIYSKLKKINNFELVIDAQGLLKSAIVSKVIGKSVSGLDYLSAKEPLASLLYKNRHRIDCRETAPFRFASLIGKSLGVDISKSDLLNKEPYLFWDKTVDYKHIDKFFETQKKSIIIVSGASNPSKCIQKRDL